MDKNLSPGQAYSESFDDYHETEETQNHQDDLCHNILTGKLLMPAAIALPMGSNILTWSSDSDDLGGNDSPGQHSSAMDFFEVGSLPISRDIRGVLISRSPRRS